MVSVEEFAEKIKAKYPDYAEVDNNTLAQKMLEKFPEYRDKVDLSSGAPQEGITSPMRGEEAPSVGMSPEPPPSPEDPGIMQSMFPSGTAAAQATQGMGEADLDIAPMGEGPIATYQEQQGPMPTLTAGPEGQLDYQPEGGEITEELPTLERTGLTDDERSMQQGLGLVQDISSLGERALGATFNKEEGKSFLQELANPEASITRQLKQKLKESDTNPFMKFVGETLLSIASDPTMIGGVAKQGLKAGAKTAAGQAIKKKTKGAIEGALGEGSIERIKELPGKLKPSEMISEAGELATGIDKEVLRKWSTKAGRKELRAAYGSQDEVGQEIIDFVRNFDERFPEHKQITKMLENMKPIQLKDVVKTLKGGKVKNPIGANLAMNKKIDTLVDQIEDKIELPDTKFTWGKRLSPATKDIMGQTTAKASVLPGGSRIVKGKTIRKKELSATEFRDLRKQLDDEVEAAFDKEFRSGYEKSLTKGRKSMMESLKKAAKDSGMPQYENLMELYAKKVGTMERVKSNLGKGLRRQEETAESYVANIGSFGKTQKLQNLKDLDEMFGKDFAKKAQLAQEARQLGKAGKDKLEVPLGPKFQTGAKWTAIALGGIGSPKFVSRILIPMFDIPEESAATLGKMLYSSIKGQTIYTPMYKVLSKLSEPEKKRLERLAKAFDKKPSKKLENEIRKIVKK